MAGTLRFGVLGPLEVSDGERVCTPTAPRLRTLIALLLVRANTVVSRAELVEELWGDDPPAAAANSIQVFVRRVRRLLAPHHDARHPGQVLSTSAAGYRLRVADGQLDLAAFERDVAAGRRAVAAGDAAAAADALRTALGHWRGPALSGVSAGRLLESRAVALEEARLAALETRIDADLRLGRHRDLVAELHHLTGQHPLSEGFWRQAMLALYRCGRQAEALDVYQRLRAGLVSELGLEPSAEVRRLHQAILSGDPDLDLPAAPVRVVPPAEPEPLAQLPTGIADFTGRAEQVAAVRAALVAARPHDGVTPIVVISGEAGIGKTALAVHVGHRVRASFPDGQLYANLRGASGGLSPGEVLVRFLRALGYDGAGIPDSVDERADLLRSRLAGRRILVVLDDASDESQVRPLLPGDGGSAVLVTSRRRLAGLEGAVVVDVPLLAPDEAVELLRRLAGTPRVAGESGPARRVTELCGMLPLAVRVAGAKLAARPHWSVTDLERRLADERDRLAELRLGDLDVRASFALSYHACPPPERRVFRLLSVAPACDFPAWVAAAACDLDPRTAESAVEHLVDVQLLQVAGRDGCGGLRYGFHDLLRVFAAERSAAEDTEAERRAALSRVLAGYCRLARTADDVLRPGQLVPPDPRPAGPGDWRPGPDLVAAVRADPVGWFAAERAALVSAVEAGHAAGMADLACATAAATVGFFDLRSFWDDWGRVAECAVAAATRTGDRYATALARYDLALLRVERDLISNDEFAGLLAEFEELGCHREAAHARYEIAMGLLDERRTTEALEHAKQALTDFAECGDARGEGFAYRAVGNALRHLGRFEEALWHFDRSLALFRRFGDRRWEAYVLLGRAGVAELLGRVDRAGDDVARCLTILQALADQRWEAYALRTLGDVRRRQRRFADAAGCYRRGVAIMRRLGDRRSEGYLLRNLGDLYREWKRFGDARPLLERSLAIFEEFGDPRGRPMALLGLAGVARGEGRYRSAVKLAEEALTAQRRQSVPLWEARILTELGEALAATGDSAQAKFRWREALDIFRQIEAPEAERVAELLGTGSGMVSSGRPPGT